MSTFLDLSDELQLVDLVVLGDSLVKAGRITPRQLVDAAAVYQGRARRLARRAAGLVRADVDSPMETRLRLLMILAGLPEPVINHKIRWEDGRVRWRFDLSFPDHRLVIEFDGRQHAESDVLSGHNNRPVGGLLRRKDPEERIDRPCVGLSRPSLAGLFVLTVGGLVIAVLFGLWHGRSRLPESTDRERDPAGDRASDQR